MDITECKFTQEHEWIYLESDDIGRVGLTYYAQSHLGDIVFLDLPEPGVKVEQFGKLGEVESVKAVSDVLSPAGGVIVEANKAAIDEPSLVNKDPYGDGWLVKLKLNNPSELDALMNKGEYDEFMKQCEESSKQE
ncbi:Glycine cleavage system H protein [subsurface metagenome]